MSMTILIIDDEPFVCEDLKLKLMRTFSDIVIDADICCSANHVPLMVETRTYDVIFTDIRMPFMNGINLIKMLRQNNFQGKIIVLSGFDDFEYVHDAFLVGADDYVLKPVSVAKLKEVLPPDAGEPCVSLAMDLSSCTSIIEYAQAFIHANYTNPRLEMADVAEYVSVSYNYFSTLFRKETGTSFPSYLLTVRIEKAKELLMDTSIKISEICYMVGFKYPQQFSRDFKKITGMYPREFQIKVKQNSLKSDL